jgi:hypothetical protein
MSTEYSEENGLTMFYMNNPCGLGPLCLPVAFFVHEGGGIKPPTRHGAFWLKLLSIFSLFLVTTSENERSHVLTIPLILAPCPL